MENALSQFARGAGKGVPVNREFRGTGQGFRDLCDGRANVIPASAKMDVDTADRCKKAGVTYLEIPIAFDAVAVIAHPSRVGMGEINLDELKRIFSPDSTGKVTQWSQVRAGLADGPLKVVSLDPKSGTNAFFGSVVHGMRGFVRYDATISMNHADIIKFVANEPNAIGFVSLAALSDSRAPVWKVPVNFGRGAVAPTREAVLNESYSKFARLLYIYVAKSALNEKDGHVRSFTTWLVERGSKLASYEGFIPLIDANYADGLRALSAR